MQSLGNKADRKSKDNKPKKMTMAKTTILNQGMKGKVNRTYKDKVEHYGREGESE